MAGSREDVDRALRLVAVDNQKNGRREFTSVHVASSLVNGGRDLPAAYLEALYAAVVSDEIKAHELGRGDAIVFNSEKVHNVSPITRGVRVALVLELWLAGPNMHDRNG